MLQPAIVIESSDDLSQQDEIAAWEAMRAVCGRDSVTGDRLLIIRPKPAEGDQAPTIELEHITTTHIFEMPANDPDGIAQIARLANVRVVYRFRHRPDVEYRGFVLDEAGNADLNEDAAELWVSSFWRSDRPNPHIRAMRPASRSMIVDASSADVFMLDLTRFDMPAADNCVFCAQPLGDDNLNREHVVPDWLRSLVAEHLGTPVAGVVANAHAQCNIDHASSEAAISEHTARHLDGELATSVTASTVSSSVAVFRCAVSRSSAPTSRRR